VTEFFLEPIKEEVAEGGSNGGEGGGSKLSLWPVFFGSGDAMPLPTSSIACSHESGKMFGWLVIYCKGNIDKWTIFHSLTAPSFLMTSSIWFSSAQRANSSSTTGRRKPANEQYLSRKGKEKK